MGSFKNDLNKAVRGAMDDAASDYEKMLDRLRRQYQGRPVDHIKPALTREWKRLGGSISDPELTTYAQHISDGTRVKVKVGY